ncbi:MAG TPA: type II toxin-antitoxin system HicB family antitoxin [Longimicrobium sp.]|nr:type II toxin-antitoxin system HicB family antitoxin [Longimicrobium sp.]
MTDPSTRFSVGLEQGADGSLFAHALTLPGCAASGPTPEAAMAAFERELHGWLFFLSTAGERVPPPDAELEVAVDEWVESDARVAEGESTACFAADLRPLDQPEIERALRLLGDLRGRVLARVRRLPRAVVDRALDRPTEGGWTVRRVLEELARAQWWTLSRLGSTPMAGAADATLARLDTAMALVVQHLGGLPEAERGRRLELDGEEWTPRKVLRRLLWLEWTLGRAAVRGLDTPTGEDG